MPPRPRWKPWLHATPVQGLRALWAVLRWGPTGAWRRVSEDHNAGLAQALADCGVSARGLPEPDVFNLLRTKDTRPLAAALRAGAPVTHTGTIRGANSLLHEAAVLFGTDRHEHVGLLLAYGADVNARNHLGRTPLQHLFEETSPALDEDEPLKWPRVPRLVALALLKAGSDVAVAGRPGRSMLHLAPLDLEIIEALVAHGCDPSAVVEPLAVEGEPCLLFRAVEIDFKEEWPLWLNALKKMGQGPDTRSRTGETLAWRVVAHRGGTEGALKILREWGFPVEGVNPEGDTLLHVWARTETGTFAFVHTGDALLDIPAVAAQAGWRNHLGQTAADILVQQRSDWLGENPSCQGHLARLRALEMHQSLPLAPPDALSPPVAECAPRRRLRL